VARLALAASQDRAASTDAMPHITLNTELPGISGLFRYRPQTAAPMEELAEVLLRGPNTLTRGERELIAAYVSSLNECRFCSSSHAAFAAAQLPGGMTQVRRAFGGVGAGIAVGVGVAAAGDVGAGEADGAEGAPVSAKLRALLDIAGAVQKGGRDVTTELVDAARAAGASDVEIHDSVLIAAAFCMMNRYVDGLATFAPDDPDVYAVTAKRIVEHGYRG
jgi:alkylhydroperoxidase family enzyme